VASVHQHVPAMLRVADLVQVVNELAKPVLLQADIHLQGVIRGRSANFNPASGNVDPLMLDLGLLPTFVEVRGLRDSRMEDTKQSDSPE